MAHKFPVLGNEAAHTRTAGGKTLGHGIDDDDVVTRPLSKFAKRLELLPAVDELAVRLVTDEEEVVLDRNVNEHLHLLVAEHNARRIAGVRDDDGTGVLVDLRFDLFTVGIAVALFRRSRNGANARAAGIRHRRIVGIEWLRDQNLVAVVENTLHRDGKRFAAAVGDIDLVSTEVHVELCIILPDRLDQLGDTG